jgi:hypothetical protein
VSGHRLKASALARAIEHAEQVQVVSRACQLGERMRTENGLAVATNTLEAIMAA